MFAETPFAGIHQLAWFDWAMLIPYFAVLAILSVYGIHRYDIIRTYFKHRKKATGEPPRRFEQLPPVTIQLPLYNERYVVERLIEEVVKIEYPQGTAADPGAGRFHRRYRALCRSAGGALPATWATPSSTITAPTATASKRARCRKGWRRATGELVAVFDADFCPPPDFLTRTVNLLRRPQGGRGADALELPQPRLQLPDRSGGHAAGRAFHSGARRAVARGLLLQFQRHGRHPAAKP